MVRTGLQTFVLFTLTLPYDVGSTKISTVCYGSGATPCVTHRLTCSSSSLIEIINTTYAYRDGCQSGIGLSDCNNITCCEEQPGDCFVDFPNNDSQTVLNTCNNKTSCSIGGLRIDKFSCNGRFSAYSKIEYICRESTTSTSSKTVTSSSVYTSSITTYSESQSTSSASFMTKRTSPSENNKREDYTEDKSGALIGGVIGCITAITLILLGVLFIYRRTQKSESKSKEIKTPNSASKPVQPHYYTIDGGQALNHVESNDYAEITLEDKSETQTYNYNHIGDTISIDKSETRTCNYNHIGDTISKSEEPREKYNHVVVNGYPVTEDNYNHIGAGNSNSLNLDTNYHHISNMQTLVGIEDNYHHIGEHGQSGGITDDNYNHIGSDGIQTESCDNNNQVRSDGIQAEINDSYNHIRSDGIQAVSSDNYNHGIQTGSSVINDGDVKNNPYDTARDGTESMQEKSKKSSPYQLATSY